MGLNSYRMLTLAILLSSTSLAQVSANLTLDRGDFYPGEGATALLEMFNHGFSQVDAMIDITMSPDIGPSYSNLSIGSIPARGTSSYGVQIHSASSITPGMYPVFVTLKTGSDTLQLSRQVRILGWPVKVDVALPSGGNRTARVTVTNTGSEAIELVNVSLSLPSGFDPRNVKLEALIIAPGHSESKEFSVYRSGDASGGISLEASFTDPAGKHSFTKVISLSGGAPSSFLPGFSINETIIYIIIFLVIVVLAKSMLK